MAREIHSTKNPLVRRFRQAATSSAGRMLAEGRRLAIDALDAGCEVIEAAWSPRLLEAPAGEDLLARLRATDAEIHECGDKLLQRLSQLDTHQGISLILRRPDWRAADLLGAVSTSTEESAPLVLVAAGIRDPGNLGALVRSAEAAGASGVLVVSPAADPFRDKALRGSAGSLFRLPCLAPVSDVDAVAVLRELKVRVLVAEGEAAAKRPAVNHWDADFRGPTALVLGAEGAGVPDVILDAADGCVTIPMLPSVESLNVAVAAGVLLFEAQRQRKRQEKQP